MNKYLLAAAVAFGATAPAFAQDAATFTGPKIELIGGWDQVQADGDHDSGVDYGIGLGYDLQLGGAVVGIEGEAADSTTKSCFTDFFAVGDSTCLRAQRDLYVGGRVGAVVGSNALVYAKAGYTNARASLDYHTAAGSPFPSASLGHESLDGFRVGAGLEYALGRHFYGKAEYRYSNYESDFSRHQVVAGLGIRF